MSLQTNVNGFIPATEEHKRMVKVYKACEDANVSLPHEVESYFKVNEEASLLGRYVDISKAIDRIGQYKIGVRLDDLPTDVRYLEFYTF